MRKPNLKKFPKLTEGSFPPHTFVRPTPYAVTVFPQLKGKRGEVVRSCKSPWCRRIKWDYRKTSENYHRVFFRHDPQREAAYREELFKWPTVS